MQKLDQRQNLASIDNYLQENASKSLFQEKGQFNPFYPQHSTIHSSNQEQRKSYQVNQQLTHHNSQKQNQKSWMKYYGHRDKYRQSQKNIQNQNNCSCVKISLIILLLILVLGIAGYLYWRCGINKCSNSGQSIINNSNNGQRTQPSIDSKALQFIQPTINFISPQIMIQTHKLAKQKGQTYQANQHKRNKQVHIRKFEHFS